MQSRCLYGDANWLVAAEWPHFLFYIIEARIENKLGISRRKEGKKSLDTRTFTNLNSTPS